MKYALKNIKGIILTIVISITTLISSSQVDSSSNCLLELIKLEARYSAADNLSFNVIFFYTEKDSTGIYRTDSMLGTYKIRGNNLWSNVDSVQEVQNEQYTVIDYPNEQTLFITKPDLPTKAIFSQNFLDSTFLQYHVNSMVISNNGGNQKRLSMFFKSESTYLSYDLYYDSTTYLINKLEYKLKENSDYLKISLVFSNYVTTALNDSLFSTTKYFTEINHKYVIAPAYYSYEVINPPNEIENDDIH